MLYHFEMGGEGEEGGQMSERRNRKEITTQKLHDSDAVDAEESLTKQRYSPSQIIYRRQVGGGSVEGCPEGISASIHGFRSILGQGLLQANCQ